MKEIWKEFRTAVKVTLGVAYKKVVAWIEKW